MSELFQLMDRFVNEPSVREAIERACSDCEDELRANATLEETWRVVVNELSLPGTAAGLRSLWVFAFSPGGRSETHKHSNSTQYTRSWRGHGQLRVGEPDKAVPLALPPPAAAGPGQEWVKLPPHLFHQAIAGDAGWCVVSFQTAAASELQEEPFSGAPHSYLNSV